MYIYLDSQVPGHTGPLYPKVDQPPAVLYLGPQKGTIILTTAHLVPYCWGGLAPPEESFRVMRAQIRVESQWLILGSLQRAPLKGI